MNAAKLRGLTAAFKALGLDHDAAFEAAFNAYRNVKSGVVA